MSRRINSVALSMALISSPVLASAQRASDEDAPGTMAGTSSFYDGANCTSWMFNMDPWTNWSWLWPSQNDKVTSMAVGPRTRVVLYEHIDYGGASWPFDNWNGYAVCVNVPWWIDNKTSSIRTMGI